MLAPIAADVFTLHVDMLMVPVVFINAIEKAHPKASEKSWMLVITMKSPFSNEKESGGTKKGDNKGTVRSVSWRGEVPVMMILRGQQQALMLRVQMVVGQEQQLAGVHAVHRKGPLILETVSGKITWLL